MTWGDLLRVIVALILVVVVILALWYFLYSHAA